MKIQRLRLCACIALLLALLAGCSGTPAPSGSLNVPNPSTASASPSGELLATAMGRYVEKELSQLEYSNSIGAKQYDGKVYAVAYPGKQMAVSEDLINWETQDTGNQEDLELTDFAVGPDGSLYLLSITFENEELHSHILRVKDGASEPVPFEAVGSAAPVLEKIDVLPSGNLLASTWEQGVLQYAPDGKLVKQYQVSSDCSAFAVFGDELAILSQRDATITIVSLESGGVLRQLPIEMDSGRMDALLRYDAEGALHYANGAGIYRVNAGGALLERIVDGSLCSLSDPMIIAKALLFDQENCPVVHYAMDNERFTAYVFDETVPTEPSIVLNLFSLYENMAIQTFVSTFQRKHPEAKVQWTVAMPRGSSITEDDAIRTLNTEVLAGKGPDLFVLDGLPIESYAEKGVLMDISGVVQPRIDQAAVLPSVAGAFVKDGKITAVPTSFALPMLWGDVKGIATLADLAAWATAHPDVLPFSDMSPANLMVKFYTSSLPAWKDENGRLKPEMIEAFLTDINTIIGAWTPETAKAQLPGDDMSEFGEFMLAYNKVAFASLPMDDIMSASGGYGAVVAAQKGGGFIPLPGQAHNVFIPNNIFGANANSAHPELCAAFIEMALSDDANASFYLGGFPVRVSALDAMFADTSYINAEDGIGDYVLRYVVPPEAELAQMRALLDGAATPSLGDPTLYIMLVEETAPFFEGSITAAQAAQNFASKASTFLTE